MLWNVQTIRPDGKKRFMPKGRFLETYFSIGNPGDHILICEGMATAKSLHEETGLPTVAAMSTANLVYTAEIIHSSYPGARITICADNDESPDRKNHGVLAATDAAKAIHGYLAIPPFPGDFNDMAVIHGIDTKKVIYAAAPIQQDY
jgi:putative DNA primase/helicase